MKTVTATHASRGFRGARSCRAGRDDPHHPRLGHPVAELRPITPATGRELRAALADAPALDADIEADIADAIELLDSRVNGSWPDN